MEENDKICAECKAKISNDVSTCPFCGCPASITSTNHASIINKNKRIIGIALCIASIICFIIGIGKITNEKYAFYLEHRNECQINLEEVQDIADSYSNGYFKSSYQDIADTYIDMIENDQKKIWTYRIEAIIFCGIGATLLVLGIKKIKYKGE